MPVTVDDFRNRFPEFRTVGELLIQQVLDEAALQVSEAVWGELADAGTLMRAAHLLALSPMGQQARKKNEKDTTTYGMQFRAMQRQVTAGYRLI